MPEIISNLQVDTIPARLLEGASIARMSGPERILCDRMPARTHFIGQGLAFGRINKDGEPALSNPAANPMAFALTRIERDDGITVALCSELADNPGTSVTNAWPGLAEFLCERFELDPARTIFVEHYGSFSYQKDIPEHFDRVEICWRNGHASLVGWHPVRQLDLRAPRL